MSLELKIELMRLAMAAGLDPGHGDALVFTISRDGRVDYRREVATGAVVCGRKPGVLLLAVTSDGVREQLGVSSEEQAETIITALRRAFSL